MINSYTESRNAFSFDHIFLNILSYQMPEKKYLMSSELLYMETSMLPLFRETQLLRYKIISFVS